MFQYSESPKPNKKQQSKRNIPKKKKELKKKNDKHIWFQYKKKQVHNILFPVCFANMFTV